MLSDYDKKQIEYGNKWLDLWLRDEPAFIGVIDRKALQFCFLWGVYPALVNAGEWNEIDENVLIAKSKAKEWSPLASPEKHKRLVKCILCLMCLAEMKLKITSGL